MEYVLTGRRMYEPEAVAFARLELERRKIDPGRLEELRRPVEAKLTMGEVQNASTAPAGLGGRTRVEGVLCTACGVEAPTRSVEYHQNIGALFMRFSRTYRGDMCARCNGRTYRKTLWTNLFLGWWGVISFFMTVVYLIANTITVLRTIGMPEVPEGAKQPVLDQDAIGRIAPQAERIAGRLIEGMDVNDIAREFAPGAGVTPGQVVLYALGLRRRMAEAAAEAARPAFGFPVVAGGQAG